MDDQAIHAVDAELEGRHPARPAGERRTRQAGGEQLTVRALARGLSILSLFDAEHRDWSLDEIIARTGIPRMTGYRLARTLRSEGYLVIDRPTGRYSLGPAMLTGTYLSESYDDLVVTGRPYLEALAAETGESVTLAVEVRGVAVCADMLRSARPNRQEVAVGRLIGDTDNAHGKLFAAYKPPEERQKTVGRPHERRTHNTLTHPDALASELRRIRQAGTALDMEERDLGTCAVAAPVRDQMGHVVATVAVVVPTGRFGVEARERCTRAVERTARDLSAFLGYADAGRPVASA